jgi:hypothetical protein
MAAAEQKKSYKVIKQFRGVNTKANRTALEDGEFSWLENAMPIGYANIKTVSGEKNTAVTFGNVTTALLSANINNKDYQLAFQEDGRCEFVDVETSTKGNVAVAGTFSNSRINITQYKDERVLIGDPTNGVYSWDGTNLVSIGSVGFIGITNRGAGYTTTPSIVISAPNETGGVQAQAEVILTANAVTGIAITEAGTGYTTSPTVTISGGGGTNAAAIAGVTTFKTGTVTVFVTNGGTGYTNASNTVVTISGGGGTNAAGTAILAGGQISQVIITNNGTGYTNASNITVTISGGGGSNAAARAIINSNPVTGIQTFSGRAWVAQGRSVSYSAAGSYSDFVSLSSGIFTITDATLRSNITQLLSANNFLYIFGEDSINVFSDVRVTDAGITLFTNTNISASVGSRLQYAIFPYFRSVLFMNEYGVYALVGSTTSKISDPLDGVFPDIDFTTARVTAGQVLLNNILCAAFNIRYNDSGTNRYVQAIFFEKKWFFSNQNNLILVSSIATGGRIKLFGTNGSNFVELYGDATVPVDIILETALDAMGDPIRDKQALKIGIEATLGSTPTTMNAYVDSESAQSPVITFENSIAWTNYLGNEIDWTNNLSVVIGWLGAASAGAGYYLYKSDAEMWGKYLGITINSTSTPFVINGFQFEHELRTRF